jgi:hypothetical protein
MRFVVISSGSPDAFPRNPSPTPTVGEEFKLDPNLLRLSSQAGIWIHAVAFSTAA